MAYRCVLLVFMVCCRVLPWLFIRGPSPNCTVSPSVLARITSSILVTVIPLLSTKKRHQFRLAKAPVVWLLEGKGSMEIFLTEEMQILFTLIEPLVYTTGACKS